MVKKVVGKKPTKNTKQTKSRNFVGSVKRHKLLIIILVIVIGLIVVIGSSLFSNKIAINQEKKQFESAEASLDQLQTEIIAKLGEPVSANSTNVCGYASTVDGRGDRGCGVGFELSYATDDLRKYASDLGITIDSNPSVKTTYTSYNPDNIGTYQSLGSDFTFNSSLLQCGATVKNMAALGSPKPEVRIRISCYGDAKAEYYPVKE